MGSDQIRSYRDLKVWQHAMSIAEDCYRLTGTFPKEEMYGMTSQVRRSSASIAANIAEGYGRETTKSYVHFLRIAQGSLKELETHLLLASRVGISSEASIAPAMTKCDELGRMLRVLIRNLNVSEAEA